MYKLNFRIKRKGFTLVEIIVSVLLFTILVAGAFGAFVNIQHYVRISRHRIQALNYARQSMEKFRLFSYSSAQLGVTGWTAIPITGATEVTMTREYRIFDFTAGATKEIQVRVRWTEWESQHEEILKTLVGNNT